MSSQSISIGDTVKLVALPPYLKTADPMPMLRPANIIKIEEEGIVVDCRPGNYWVVHFTQGNFLIESQYLQVVVNLSHTDLPENES